MLLQVQLESTDTDVFVLSMTKYQIPSALVLETGTALYNPPGNSIVDALKPAAVRGRMRRR